MDNLNDEEKRVLIEPLPEKKVEMRENQKYAKEPKVKVKMEDEEIKRKLSRKKPGRKKMKPEDRKNAPKTNERHVMTEARKKALERAREVRRINNLKAKQERENSAKEQMETSKLIKAQESQAYSESVSSGTIVKPEENDLHVRLGSLEKNIGNILELIQSGAFSGGDRQAQQTTPAPPTELRQPDITKPEESFTRIENGGDSIIESRRVREGFEPPQANIHQENILFF